MTFLINKLVFWILFSLQLILALCNNSRESAKMKFMNTFGHDFDNIPANGEVYVWKINADNEKFIPEDYSQGFRIFNTAETYIILAKKWTNFINLYYWVGKETSLEDKKNAAKYAIMFYHLFHKIWKCSNNINFSREYETLETESLLHTLHQLKGTIPSESRYAIYRENRFPLNGPNLYIVKGGKSTRVKKVTFSLRWVKPNICLIIDPSGHLFEEFYFASIWCGKETNKKVRRRAREFSKEFSSSFMVNVITGVGTKYKNLIELLEDDCNNGPSDVDVSSDDKINEYEFVKSRDELVKLFELSKDHPSGRKEISDRPIHTEIFWNGNFENFLFDSNSIAGLSFITGYMTDVEAQIWAIQYVEDYLNSQIEILGRPAPMRIVFPFAFHFDFMINQIDLPIAFLSNGDLELW